MKTKIELTVKRNSGEIETINLTKKFPHLNQTIFNTIKTETAKAGKGEVLQAELTESHSNYPELVENWNNLQNEGAEGYTPEPDFFEKQGLIKNWETTSIIK